MGLVNSSRGTGESFDFRNLIQKGFRMPTGDWTFTFTGKPAAAQAAIKGSKQIQPAIQAALLSLVGFSEAQADAECVIWASRVTAMPPPNSQTVSISFKFINS